MRKLMAILAMAMLLAFSAAPAMAAKQEGLVNVNVEDVVVQVPIGVAANVCGVNAAILAEQTVEDAPVCDAEATALPVAFRP